jgi:hypothetical protein
MEINQQGTGSECFSVFKSNKASDVFKMLAVPILTVIFTRVVLTMWRMGTAAM